jgi:hypothetical protein
MRHSITGRRSKRRAAEEAATPDRSTRQFQFSGISNVIGLSASGGGTILSRLSNGVSTNTVEDNNTNGAFTGIYLAK